MNLNDQLSRDFNVYVKNISEIIAWQERENKFNKIVI